MSIFTVKSSKHRYILCIHSSYDVNNDVFLPAVFKLFPTMRELEDYAVLFFPRSYDYQKIY